MDMVVFHDDFTGFSGAQNGDLTKSNKIGTFFTWKLGTKWMKRKAAGYFYTYHSLSMFGGGRQ